MKKLLYISLILMVGCTKMEIEPIPQPKVQVDIFSMSESSVSDGDEITFKLTSDSTYILKLVDFQTGQVLTKEKIIGKIGDNKLKIYTKSLPSKYLYLVLEDINKNQKGKTKLTLN